MYVNAHIDFISTVFARDYRIMFNNVITEHFYQMVQQWYSI